MFLGPCILFKDKRLFLNDLLDGENDGQKINGVTHLVIEMDNNSQKSMDRQLVTGRGGFRIVSERWGMVGQPMEPPREIEDKNRTLQLGFEGCYNVLLGDVSDYMRGQLKKSLGDYYWLAAREAFAVKLLQARRLVDRRNVVFWKWGGTHTEKHRLPFYIRIQDPAAKVVSVAVNGGTYVDALAFDRVLRELGWLERTFILRLDGYREADYVVHVPTQGRELWSGIARQDNPVLQNMYDPPE